MKSLLHCIIMLFYFFATSYAYGQETDKKIVKRNAFTILVTKCNVCHATKKRQDIFTLENMDSLSAFINKQVFIKKKMPKGRKIKLTEEELKALRAWLDLSLN